MKIDNLVIRPIINSDINQVAIIHCGAFKDSALTKLGREPVRKYYLYLLNYQKDNYNIGCFDSEGRLIGFCFSGLYGGSLSGFLKENHSFLVNWVLYHPWNIINPIVIDRIKMAFNVSRKKSNPVKNYLIEQVKSFGILSIAVDPEKQGLGVGREIMNAVENEARSKNYERLHLTVHPNNSKSIGFYENCGWKKIADESGNWSGFMIKPLI